MYKEATRKKLRFNSPAGIISTEDLWHMPLEALDSMYSAFTSQIEAKKSSLLGNQSVTAEQELIRLKADIIKDIVETRLDMFAESEKKVLKKQKKQEILALIHAKKTEAMKESSIEDLEEMLNNL